ncbi:MAG TPA: UDP-N-acetylmuramoyl-L-alanyl-D-glutamate--2,6-diaminopimelate ligase [Acidimicrobiales bacterium]
MWGHPARRLTMVGVTGTNGKTTTTHIIRSILEASGRQTGVIGTLSGTHTTPEAPELQARLAAHVAAGDSAVAMEVSSHALAMHRVDGIHFSLAVFTNLGRDHLDFHGTVERYFAAKARLFSPDLAAAGVVNVDDTYGRLLFDAAEVPVTPFSLDEASGLVIGREQSSFRWRGRDVVLPLTGRFNVSNALAAATAASVVGIDEDAIVRGLHAVVPVAGRFEPVATDRPFTVLVDYAHTPDALTEALHAAREAAGGGEVIVVFGCGGDRDQQKRPAMGAVAATLADVVVITSDNPRSEDPAAIIEAVTAGIPPSSRARIVVEPDRRAAIGVALAAAGPGDVVLVAGKGHETYQEIYGQMHPFDDRVVVREMAGGV